MIAVAQFVTYIKILLEISRAYIPSSPSTKHLARMPVTNGPAVTLAAYVDSVQAALTASLLSKQDAALGYQSKADAAAANSNISGNTTSVNNLNLLTNELQSSVVPVAPPGQRSLWQYATSGTVGWTMYYSSDFGYVYNGGTTTAAYSIDGGVTFLAVVFDVAPTAQPSFASKPGLVVAFTTAGETYTSTNGINFTKRTAAPGNRTSFGIEYFAAAGLFVAGANVDATHQIITTGDGLTWTARTTPITIANVHSNSTMLVAVGSTAPYSTYSLDGITWTNTTSTNLLACRALAWSPERLEWLANANGTGRMFSSATGTTWTDLGVIAPGLAGDTLMWLGGIYDRWYAAAADTYNNYSLWSSPDAHTYSFVGTTLDGALLNSTVSYISYIPSLDRILICSNNSPNIAYNTTRKYDIKSLGDNIRVRGSAVDTSKFSGTGDFTLASSLVETAIVPSTSIGTLVYPAAQPVGMRIKFSLALLNTSGAGDTLTLRFKSQAGTLLTHAIVVAGGASSLVTKVRGSFVVRTATLSMVTTATQSGLVGTGVTATPAYDPTIANTFSVTAQWGAALSTCVVTQFNAATKFINGA
jgi:hypothetical protein